MRALLALLAVLGPVPAHLGSGDDVVPRDTVSVIESVEPALPVGIVLDVVGGDTFMRVRSAGHTVEVKGYEGEPYIRIRPDGTVLEAHGSTTWWLNRSRFGGTVPTAQTDPPGGAADSAGEWVVTARNGTAMWHDHRIHWMSPSAPVTIDDKGSVQHWKVPVEIDGTLHTIGGTLYLRDRASAAWWAVVVLGALASVVLARGRRLRWYSFLTWVSALSCLTGFLEWRDLPAGAQITPLMLLFGAGALIASNAASVMQRESAKDPKKRAKREWIAVSLAAGAGVTMVISGWMNSDQVRAAYVPFMGPLWLPRLAVTLMIGAGAVAAVDGVVRVMKVEPQAS